jgi:hypothetical protein
MTMKNVSISSLQIEATKIETSVHHWCEKTGKVLSENTGKVLSRPHLIGETIKRKQTI